MDAVRNVFDNFNYRIFYSLRYFRRLAAHALQQPDFFRWVFVRMRRKRKGGCCSRPLLIFELEWG